MWTKHTFNHNAEQKVWFVSDTHFGHNRDFIYKPRGFNEIEAHDETIIQRWNERVSENDTVIHLGDFIVGAGDNADKLGNSLLARLKGSKVLIWGNHNSYLKNLYKRLIKGRGWDYMGENTEIYPLETDAFGSKVTFVGHNLLAKIKTPEHSQYVFCCHFAHAIWIDSHQKNKNVVHLSGHSHGTHAESQPDNLDHKRLDVGIENFGGPVSFDEVMAIMKNKNNKILDNHSKDTNPSF